MRADDLSAIISEIHRRGRQNDVSRTDGGGLFDFVLPPAPTTRGEPDFTPTPTGERFLASPAIHRLARGPVGCGKTHLCSRGLLNDAIATESVGGVIRCRAFAVRQTAGQLRDTTIPSFLEAYPPALGGEFRKSDKVFNSEFSVIQPDGVSRPVQFELLFRAFDRPEDVRRFRGLNATIGWANELRELPIASYKVAFERTGRHPATGKQWQKMVADTNSFDARHPAYKFFYQREGVVETAAAMRAKGIFIGDDEIVETFDYPSGRSKYAENIERLPPGYYDLLAQSNGEKWARIYCDNEFGLEAPGKVCYQEFGDHNIAPSVIHADPRLPLFIGADHGKDPAIVICQQRPDGKGIVIVDEIYGEDITLDSFLPAAADELTRLYPPHIYQWEQGGIDPAAQISFMNNEISPLDLFREWFSKKSGIPVEPAISNDPATRIAAVNRLCGTNTRGTPNLLICPQKCAATIRSMRLYHYRQINLYNYDGTSRYNDKPEKDNESHRAEAVQYAVLRPFTGGAAVLDTGDGKRAARQAPKPVAHEQGVVVRQSRKRTYDDPSP